MSDRAAWVLLAAAVAAFGWLLDAAGLPSSYLLAALVLGVVVALRWPGRLKLGDPAFFAAQVVTGVAIGALLEASSLEALAQSWLPVMLACAATLALSLAAGVALARMTNLDRPTAALGMVAGGASGIVAMARELGGDDRLVAILQYLRVLIVVALTPVLVAVLFSGGGDGGAALALADEPWLGEGRGRALGLAACVVGGALALIVRVPAGAVLVPMVVAAALALGTSEGAFTVPALAREAAFAVLGLQVGLRFVPETLREARAVLVPSLGLIFALLGACGLLAVALDATTSATLLDSYLATTPGGLFAVLAAAFGAGADMTFILGVQTIRLFVMLLLAPLAVRRLIAA